MKTSPRFVRHKWEVPLRGRLMLWQRISEPQLFVCSFALLVLVGTLGLKLLPGLYLKEPLGWLDALFTATSAVCVTGLTVVDTATHFTFAGQAWILLLIQLGGLGMIVFASLFILAIGKRLSLRQEALSAASLDVAPHIDPRQLIRDVVRFTLILEGLGALVLYLLWIPRLGWLESLWPAVFHSVSAFCNAGFSIFPDNLVGLQRSPFSLSVIMLLVIAGGLGFLTMEEFYLRYQAGRRQQLFRVSLHSRIVIITTAVLLLGGWVCFAVLEWNVSLAELPIVHKLFNAAMLSVTSRTAGFNTIDYTQASQGSNFLTILLMMIGGSPGSTAGGIKTTTFALIGLLAWSRYWGNEITSVASRSVRKGITDRAIGLFVIAFGLVTAGILLLTITEERADGHGDFLSLMFEAVSAFNTVGLSMNQTPYLSTPGRWLVIGLMFFGRVGPLTLASALTVRRVSGDDLRYAYEEVVVG